MNRIDAYRMIQRRADDAGLKLKIGCHTFRATGITAYLEALSTRSGGVRLHPPDDWEPLLFSVDPHAGAPRL